MTNQCRKCGATGPRVQEVLVPLRATGGLMRVYECVPSCVVPRKKIRE